MRLALVHGCKLYVACIGFFLRVGPTGVDWDQEVKIFNLCCYGSKNILNNANGPNNHHAKFEIFLITPRACVRGKVIGPSVIVVVTRLF